MSRDRTRRISLHLGAVLLAVLALGAAAQELPPAERERLGRGETLVEMVQIDNTPVREGVARRVLDAPLERVLRAIRDYAHYSEFMPFVTSSAATGRPGEWELALDLPWPNPDQRFHITTADATDGRGSSWRLVPGSGGDVVENRGEWDLAPFAPGHTLVTLRMRSLSGGAVPVRLQERATRESLPWVLDGLRQHINRCRYDEPRKDGCNE